MSYNIDTVRVISGQLFIDRVVAWKFAKDHKDELPGYCFLENFSEEPGLQAITNPNWVSEGSGYSFDLYKEALSLTNGTADLLLVWEGGDSVTGLRVSAGVVTEMDVDYFLVPKKHD